MKIGDYETAEFALKEFIDKNKDHDLAGNAQYWYGETFRIRQLYSDAATAYLDGYQNYPKSDKAPDNLIKIGHHNGSTWRKRTRMHNDNWNKKTISKSKQVCVTKSSV